MVFDDGVNPPVHATFPTAVGAAAGVDAILVPQLTAIDSVAGLALGGSASSAGLLAGALGFLAIAGGIGIAASHNSNGNSGSGNIDPPPVTGGNPRPAPTLTVNPLTGDNRLNGSEVNSNQTLSGTTTGVAAGQLVNVTINGTTYTAKVQADGSWSVLLPAGVLQGLHDGSYPVVVDAQLQVVSGKQDQLTRTTLISPVRGIVKDIQVSTVGGVLQPGGKLMEIVPIEEQLLIETRINPRDIAYIRPGLPATVKITAYDSSIYGNLTGVVETVSPDTLQDEVKRDQFYYRIYVRTNRADLTNKAGKLFPILPGMVASVEIKTGQKTVLDYLIKPLNKVKESLRER
nr:HlyD family efflux transporter periplasmic adaptor subunit [Yersinia enterocolitica]